MASLIVIGQVEQTDRVVNMARDVNDISFNEAYGEPIDKFLVRNYRVHWDLRGLTRCSRS